MAEQLPTVNLTPAEAAILAEENYELNSDGTPRSRPSYPQLTANVRFAFEMFARIHGTDYRPDYGVHGWEAMRNAQTLRNRITHPKRSAELNINDDEMNTAWEAFDWFNMHVITLFIACMVALGIPFDFLKENAGKGGSGPLVVGRSYRSS